MLDLKKQIFKNEYFLLTLILCLGFFLASIPRQTDRYAIHLDEWQVMAFSNELLDHGTLNGLIDPTSGAPPSWNQVGEVGTHIFAGSFQRISGITWLEEFRYLPGLLFSATILSVYVLGRRFGFGYQAALLACLVPTTVGLLGPGFLVPVSLALLFTPAILFVVFWLRSKWSLPLIVLLLGAQIVVHPPTAVCTILVLIPFMILAFKSDTWRILGIILTIIFPLVATLPLTYRYILPNLQTITEFKTLNLAVDLPRLIPLLGYVPILLAIIGTFVLSWRGKKAEYTLVFGLAILLTMHVSYYIFHRGLEIVFYRGFVTTFLIIAIVAGAGLQTVMDKLSGIACAIRKIESNDLKPYLGAVIVIVVVGLAIPARQSLSYYSMIDNADYRIFGWIGVEVNPGNGEKAVLDPWKGISFVSIAHRPVFSYLGGWPTAGDAAAYEFLRGGCSDSNFIDENKISLIYTLGECNNLLFNEVTNRTFLLREIPEIR
jgi:hypothetical protein